MVEIDQDSQQLLEALTGQAAKVVTTTLQKFPFVLDLPLDSRIQWTDKRGPSRRV